MSNLFQPSVLKAPHLAQWVRGERAPGSCFVIFDVFRHVIFVGGGPRPCKNKHQLGSVGFRHLSSKTPLFGGDAPQPLRRPPRWNNASQGMTGGGVVFGRGKPRSGIRMKACQSLREGKDGKIGEREREREFRVNHTHTIHSKIIT